MNYILASASPRRKELLGMFIRDFTVIPANSDETFNLSEPVENELMRVTELKAFSVAENNHNAVIIAADTIVLKDGIVYGKPRDENDAFNTLRNLKGGVHKVMTGVCVISPSVCFKFIDETSVTFRDYDDGIIRWYLLTGEPFDRAGAYAIQGYGCMLVSKIDGDYYNVMGLPVARLMYELNKADLFHFC